MCNGCYFIERLWTRCDAEYYGAESLEAEERAPFQPTSTDDEYLFPTEDETDLSRSVREWVWACQQDQVLQDPVRSHTVMTKLQK